MQENQAVCKICLQPQTNQDNQLLSLCKCKGSLQYVHQECFVNWVHTILEKDINSQIKCEICHQPIDGKLTQEYKFKCRKLEATSDKVMATVLIILMILFLAGIIYFVVQIVLSQQMPEWRTKQQIIAFIIAIGLFIVMEGVLAGLLIWKFSYKAETRFQLQKKSNKVADTKNREMVAIEQITYDEMRGAN